MGEASVSRSVELTFPDLFQKAIFLLKAPRRFFAEMPRDGGYGGPVLFALFWTFAASLLEMVFSRFHPSPAEVSLGMEVAVLFGGPFLTLLLGLLASGFFFLLWKFLGSQQTFQAAFRCWAFMSPLAVLSAILGLVPFLSVAVFIYGACLLAVASMEVHGLTPARSWAAWGGLCAFVLLLTGMALLSGRAGAFR